jgi:hypothetical protein
VAGTETAGDALDEDFCVGFEEDGHMKLVLFRTKLCI